MTGPDLKDVDQLRELLDLMENFSDNDQRARYILSSNWLRDRGAAAAQRIAEDTERFRVEQAARESGFQADPQ